MNYIEWYECCKSTQKKRKQIRQVSTTTNVEDTSPQTDGKDADIRRFGVKKIVTEERLDQFGNKLQKTLVEAINGVARPKITEEASPRRYSSYWKNRQNQESTFWKNRRNRESSDWKNRHDQNTTDGENRQNRESPDWKNRQNRESSRWRNRPKNYRNGDHARATQPNAMHVD